MRLIDADALKRTKVTLEDGCSIVDAARAIIRAVDLAPTIDPANLRPKGEWKPYFVTNCGIKKQSGYNATCCGRWNRVKTMSCPNCGADMRGVEDAAPYEGDGGAGDKWIPVSERTPHFSPEKWRTVIVTIEDARGKRFVSTAKYDETYQCWYEFTRSRFFDKEKFRVVAWMEKPEPYRGDDLRRAEE